MLSSGSHTTVSSGLLVSSDPSRCCGLGRFAWFRRRGLAGSRCLRRRGRYTRLALQVQEECHLGHPLPALGREGRQAVLDLLEALQVPKPRGHALPRLPAPRWRRLRGRRRRAIGWWHRRHWNHVGIGFAVGRRSMRSRTAVRSLRPSVNLQPLHFSIRAVRRDRPTFNVQCSKRPASTWYHPSGSQFLSFHFL